MADSPEAKELYTCSTCNFSIPSHLARVTCHSCPNHHLCANCHVIKSFTRPHTDSHSTMVFKQSGVVVPLPPGFAPRPPPALPPRPASTVVEDGKVRQDGGVKGKAKGGDQLGGANWGALWNIVKAPLEKKGKGSRKANVNTEEKEKGEGMEAKDVTENPESATGGDRDYLPLDDAALPPSPPKSIRRDVERVDSSAAITPCYPQPNRWEALFEEDSTPTPTFITLMSTIFSHLDPEHTGFLSPETYSGFLETQGCVESNVWKQALDGEEGEHSKEVADLELSLYFSDLLISHTLSIRARDPAADLSDEEPQSAVEGKIRNSMRFNANMPMISRQGFIDVCAIEYLRDPDSAHVWLNKAVRDYGIWKELGEMPRGVLPEKSIPKLLRRDTETPRAEPLDTVSKIKSSKSRDEKMGDVEGTPIADSTPTSRIFEPKEDQGDQPERSQKQPNSHISRIPEPLEVGKPVSPITIGSPALPIHLKGGEHKIDALTKRQGFEPGEEEEIKQQTGTEMATGGPVKDSVADMKHAEGKEKASSVHVEPGIVA